MLLMFRGEDIVILEKKKRDWRWSSLERVPHSSSIPVSHDAASASLGHVVYFAGGGRRSDSSRIRRQSKSKDRFQKDDYFRLGNRVVVKYDLLTRAWQRVADMKEPRVGHVLACLNGFVYALAGSDDRRVVESAERFDPKLNRWKFIEPLGNARCDHAVVVLPVRSSSILFVFVLESSTVVLCRCEHNRSQLL